MLNRKSILILLFSVQYRRLVTLRIDFQGISDNVPRDARIGECG